MDTPQGQAPETPTENQSTQGQEPGAENAPDIDALLKEVKTLRKEAASWRTKLRAAEEAEEQRQRAEMTELERLKADLEAERQARAAAEQQRKAQLVRTQVIAAAARLKFNDPTDAVRYLEMDQLEVGDDGTVDGLEEMLVSLLKAKKYLREQDLAGTISPTNPAGGKQPTTAEQMRQELFGPRKPGIFEGGGVVWPQE